MDGIQRLAMISLHTSPLDQPGTGDAGGMNVYVIELAKRLAARGVEVDIFTRATQLGARPGRRRRRRRPRPPHPRRPVRGADQGRAARPAVRVRPRGAAHRGRPSRSATTTSCTRHYWLSGQVGALARDRWGVPLVHSMHTMAKVKNDALADGRHPRAAGPGDRRGAGGRGRRHADRQHRRRGQAADRPVRRRPGSRRGGPPRRRPRRVPPAATGPPPVAGSACRPTPSCCSSPAGSSRSRHPTCCCARSPCCSSASPACASRLVVPIVGGPSGSGLEHPESLAELAAELGLADVVRFVPPVAQDELAELVRRGRPWSPCRRTTSPSGWSPSRPRRPAPRSSRPPSAA